MSVWSFVAGVALVGVAFVDLVWTTIAVSHGRGPLTNAVGYGIWRLAVRTGRHRVLQWTGYLVVLLVPLLWIALVWAGFVLMFLSEPGSVQQASPPYADASRVATLAYVTVGLAGAGAGFVAGGPLWQLLNNISALVGLALFTFVLTYLFQVRHSDQRPAGAGRPDRGARRRPRGRGRVSAGRREARAAALESPVDHGRPQRRHALGDGAAHPAVLPRRRPLAVDRAEHRRPRRDHDDARGRRQRRSADAHQTCSGGGR